MYEKVASAHLHVLIRRNPILKSLRSKIFLLNFLAYFQCKTGSYCITPPACSTGASEKMVCLVRRRKHGHGHHRAMLGWAQQLWGGVMVKYAISSKI